MPNMFGITIKSKEEREREYQEYVRKIFPFGDSQKEAVQTLLKEIIPEENATDLLMYYIQLKEKIADHPSMTLFEADSSLPKRAIRPRTVHGQPRIFALMEADQKIDESLTYPTAQELIARASFFSGR